MSRTPPPTTDTDKIAILVTFGTEETALVCARTLVAERLVACAQLDAPIRSIYRWQGTICDEREVRLVLKTRRDRFEVVRGRILQLHPYACPQIVALNIEAGHRPYLDWIDESLDASD
ncbi:MAG: divalent-cation tolerance protein CutA [Myxococcales bacterium]|jgi:periplasmic divalent cation tolerance protein|nr:divalent-cation tolerance protein CutA [Myxococcales bacterium]